MAVELVHKDPDVHRIRVPLPGNSLRNVNSYVVQSGGDALIIDTGFNCDESYDALVGGLREIGVSIADARLFVTHAHADHYSLAARLGCAEVLMHQDAYKAVNDIIDGVLDRVQYKTALEMGFSREDIGTLITVSPLSKQVGKEPFEATMVEEGDKLHVGRFAFEPILTPGHAPGHLCLYLPERELMFTGDHLLFDISPNVSHWTHAGDTLAEYLDSLRKVRDIPVSCALPAHRNLRDGIASRVDELLRHHDARLKECLDAVMSQDGQVASGIARHMTWARNARFDDLDIVQQLFAAGETRAHVEHMVRTGLVLREYDGDVVRYTARR